MATSNLAEAPQSSPLRLKGVFKIRIKEAKPHTNPEGNRSIKFDFEIAEPTAILVDGVDRDVTQLKLRRYCSAEEGKLGQLAALHKAAGLPLEIEWDENRFPSNVDYVGAEMWAELISKADTRKGDDGQPLTNPNTGEALVSYQHDIREFLTR